MWIAIFFSVIVAAVAGIIYVISRIGKFACVRKLTKDKRGMKILCGVGFVIALILITGITMGLINTMVCLIHLLLIWLICDLIGWIVRKYTKKEFTVYLAGIAAIVITFGYLSVGFYLAHHVWRTNYTIETDKEVGSLRIVQFADSHVGTTFHADGFRAHMKEIQKQKPDVIFITGDYVDDNTTKEDMIGCCKALGELETTYGIYFALGNHDEGYYGSQYRGYSEAELEAELEKNGVTVLRDESVLIDGRFYIVGRLDKSEEQRGRSRKAIDDLVKDLDKDKFIIDMNHQPNDYEAETEAKVDLVLSGHTHGGQLFPIIHVGEWIGANDRTYGYEKRENTNFIVTSGISDWAIKFKTGCKSEYVVIDIKGK